MCHVGPLENLHFSVSLGIAEILRFSELPVYTEVVLLKTFPQHFNYASTANIEEVMKLYNLGDKTFERDFRILCHRKHEIVQTGPNYGRMITIDIKVCRK